MKFLQPGEEVSPDFSPILGAGIIILGSAFLYGYTLAPGLLWGDDAMFQQALAQGSLTNHPVWGTLAQIFALLPWGDPAFKANLASAVYAVCAIGFLFLTAFTLGGNVRAALSASATLMVSHVFWLHAVRAEVYTLHLLLFFGGLWAFLRWRENTAHWLWLILGFAFWLTGLVNHLLLTMALPGGLFLLLSTASSSERKRLLFWLALLTVAGTFLVAVSVPEFFTEIVPSSARTVLNNFIFSPSRLGKDFALLIYQFPFLIILAVPGFYHLWCRDKAAAFSLGLMALFTAAFAATHNILEAYVFYLPFYGLVALWSGLGVSALTARWPLPRWFFTGLLLLALQVGLYRLTPPLLERVAPRLIYARDLPGRPANAFFLWPPKRGYAGARWFAETTFDLLPPGAVVVADWTLLTPLRYLQKVEGRRPDVLLFETGDQGMQAFYEYSGRHPLFLANADPRYYPIPEITERFRLEPFGPVFQLIPKSD